MHPPRIDRAPNLDVALAVAFAGFVTVTWWLLFAPVGLFDLVSFVAIVTPATVAVGSARRLPGLALALVWVSSLFQAASGTDLFTVQLAASFVAYATARYGSQTVVILSGISVGLGAMLGTVYVALIDSWARFDIYYPGAEHLLSSHVIPTMLALALALATPWAVGVIVRIIRQKDTAERQRMEARQDADQARELARLRAENANLARDVHDIVGHSLAVIIAQADSIEFTADTEVQRIREATANIATTARRSLMSIQDVLSRTTDTTGEVPAHEVQVAELIDSIKDVGRRLERHDRGTPRPVPPHVAKVAYRIMQEMLTNALRHATPTSPIRLTRSWTYRTYVFTVDNDFDPAVHTAESGRGIPGMRERVATIGGTLHVDVNPADDRLSRFTISAVLPLDRAEATP